MSKKIPLPPCGMYLGVPIYLDRGDYIFQTTGPFYTSWVSEDHDPEWYLQKVVDEHQGNMVVIWDGSASKYQLKAAAYMEDLESLGIQAPDPDWDKGANLIPEDFPPIAEHRADRWGAGFYRFVKKAADLGLYSCSCYTDANPDWAEKIAANPMFLGYNTGEAFSVGSGFNSLQQTQRTGEFTLEQAAEDFGNSIKYYFQDRRANGWNSFLVTSGSFLLDIEVANGGTDIIPHTECFAFHHMNFAMAMCRGIYSQSNLPLWGSYLAHEHYSSLNYDNEFRDKMLKASYYISYLNGAKIIEQESGCWWAQSDHIENTPMHNVPKFDAGDITINRPYDYRHLVKEARKHYPLLNYDSPHARQYRESVAEFYDYLLKNGTPEGQPEVNFAAIKGRYDMCSQTYSPASPISGCSKAADSNFAWFENMPEYGWEIFRRTILPLNNSFSPNKNLFFSGTPYGLCDITGIVAPGFTAEYLSRYKALMFTGWNSAREEDYGILLDYVKNGGLLFVSIPHLSKNVTRNFISYDVSELIHGGDFTELAGCKVLGRGRKFWWTLCRDERKIMPGLHWNHRFGTTETHLGNIEFTDDVDMIMVDDEQFLPFLFRHKCGRGEVFFMNSWEYPGNYAGRFDWAPNSNVFEEGSTGEIYKYLAKRARGTAYITDDGVDDVGFNCQCVTFSYFPSNDTVYMMNCDFSKERSVFLHFHGKATKITLQPAEFKVIQ